MTTPSANYSLLTYNAAGGDEAETFLDYRTAIAGVGATSNMNRIDTQMKVNADGITALEARKNVVAVSASKSAPNTYIATVASIVAYTTDDLIALSLDIDSDGTIGLNINALGSKPVMKVNSAGTPINLEGTDLRAGREYNFKYDGTRYIWMDATAADQINVNGTSGNFTMINSDNELEDSTVSPASFTLNAATDVSSNSWVLDEDSLVSDSATKVPTQQSVKTYVDDYKNTYYTFDVSIATSNLTVALKILDGTNATSAKPINFKFGATEIVVSSALSAVVTAAYGDIFAFDAGKIQDSDCQLFVYMINNNGTPQLGLSPNPNLQTVSTVYRDDVGQTGAVTQDNIVMSGTRNATNTCGVIGRVNVSQTDADNWQSPSVSKLVNEPIYETDFLEWTPAYTGFSADPSSLPKYKVERNNLVLRFSGTGTGTSNATSLTFTAPFIASVVNYAPCMTFDNGAFVANGGFASIAGSTRTVTIAKTTVGVSNFTASGTKTAWGQLDAEVF